MPSSTDKNGYISATCLGLTVDFFSSGFSYPTQFLKFSVSFHLVSSLIFSPFLPRLFILLSLPLKTSIISKCLFCNFYAFCSLELFLSWWILSLVVFFILVLNFKVFICQIIVRDSDSFWPCHHYGSCHSPQDFCGASFGQKITPAEEIRACWPFWSWICFRY